MLKYYLGFVVEERENEFDTAALKLLRLLLSTDEDTLKSEIDYIAHN